MTQIMDPRINTEVLGFRVERCLGTGGMGAVFLGSHPELGKAAIKFLDIPNAGRFPSVLKRFKGEARALGALRGTPYVATILNISYDPPALITEYVEGVSFAECIATEPYWSDSAILRYFEVIVKITQAMVTAHREGIIHRDLKPENIMIKDPRAESLDPRLIDFGISQMSPERGEERMTTFDSIMGSVMWAAPEQLRTPDKIDSTVDIYALGLMTFMVFNKGVHMYGAEDQFRGMSAVERVLGVTDIAADRERTERLLKGIDSRAAEVIRSCIEPNPCDRPERMKEVYGLFLELYNVLKNRMAETSKDMEVLARPTPIQTGPFETIGWGSNPGVKTGNSLATTVENELQTSLKAEKEKNAEKKTRKFPTMVVALCVAAVLAVVLGIVLSPFGSKKEEKREKPKAQKTVMPSRRATQERKPRVKADRSDKRSVPSLPGEHPRTSRKKLPPSVDPCKKGEPIPSRRCLALRCQRKSGQSPSTGCMALYYKAQAARCRQSDPYRAKFDAFPSLLMSCLKRHAWKIWRVGITEFDRVAFAALFMDEIRAHFCFRERMWMCGGPEMKFMTKRTLLQKSCRSSYQNIFGRGKKSLLHFMNGVQATKIKDWILARKTHRKKVKRKWIKSAPTGSLTCFDL